MKDKTSAFAPAVIYVGIILGAGFASGAEIMAYFVDYGKGGLLGLIVSSGLFSVTGFAIWRICKEKRITGYSAFMDMVMGRRMAKIMEVVLGLFMFIVFSAMLAASGAAIHESIGLSYASGVHFVAAVCFVVFLFDMSGILNLNAYTSPALILGCMLMGLFTYFTRSEPVFDIAVKAAGVMRKNWYMAAFAYAGYNITTAVTVLPAMKRQMARLKSPVWPALLSGAMLLALGFSIFLSLSANYSIVEYTQIPMLTLATSHGSVVEFLFMMLFLGACFTTAATNGFAVIETISGRWPVNRKFLKLIITLSGIGAAYLGFSNFIRNIYPLFALAGILEIVLIIRYYISMRAKGK